MIFLSVYTKAKREVKREAWRNVCEAVDTPEATAKLRKRIKRPRFHGEIPAKKPIT